MCMVSYKKNNDNYIKLRYIFCVFTKTYSQVIYYYKYQKNILNLEISNKEQNLAAKFVTKLI